MNHTSYKMDSNKRNKPMDGKNSSTSNTDQQPVRKRNHTSAFTVYQSQRSSNTAPSTTHSSSQSSLNRRVIPPVPPLIRAADLSSRTQTGNRTSLTGVAPKPKGDKNSKGPLLNFNVHSIGNNRMECSATFGGRQYRGVLNKKT